jgi:hypothetical protein
MISILQIAVLMLVFFDYTEKQPLPTQTSQSPTARPTPFPTPNIHPANYLPRVRAGRTAKVSGRNLAEKIQAAQDDPAVSAVSIQGGGSIAKPVILRKHTVFDSSTYSCDATDEVGIIRGVSVTDYGCMLVADGVLVEGTWRPPQALIDYWEKGDGRNPNDRYLLAVQALTAEQLAGTGTTILESTFVAGKNPAISVFQALGDACCSHTGKARNISIRGFHIKGRQRTYDGGVRSTILFGNCIRCSAQYNYLEDTGSIGITFGGSALEFTTAEGVTHKNNFARDVVAYRNVLSGVAAANTATVNTEEAYIFENYVRRPGHHDPKFGGGVCGHDHETNSDADHTRNIWVYNNLYDYEGANRESAGNAVCLQDPYIGPNRGLVVAANNVIIGGRNDTVHRYMSNGLFLNGLKDCQIINNYVFRTGQNAIQAYAIKGCLIQDNDFESTGGGGNVTFSAEGMVNTILRRNNYRDRPGLTINTAAGFLEICCSGNTYEGNSVPARANVQPVKRCP